MLEKRIQLFEQFLIKILSPGFKKTDTDVEKDIIFGTDEYNDGGWVYGRNINTLKVLYLAVADSAIDIGVILTSRRSG
jgi:hypothetical protein